MTPDLNLPNVSLVPLHLAVKIVYAALYRGTPSVSPSHERIDGLAQGMIALVPLYHCASLEAEAHRVPEPQLRDAMVRRGGREIRYADGRPPLENLFISRTSIEHVVQLLQALPDEEIPPDEPLARPARQI